MARLGKIVIEEWNSETPSSVNLASKKWTKREMAERTSPTRPTHFIFDFNTIFPSPFIAETHLTSLPTQIPSSSPTTKIAEAEKNWRDSWVQVEKSQYHQIQDKRLSVWVESTRQGLLYYYPITTSPTLKAGAWRTRANGEWESTCLNWQGWMIEDWRSSVGFVVKGFWVVWCLCTSCLCCSVYTKGVLVIWERMRISHGGRKGFWIQFVYKRRTFGGAKMRCDSKSGTVLGWGKINGK